MTRELRRNSGVISASRLRRLGFSAREMEGLVAHGDLRRLHRGVYADGRGPLRDDAHFKAALLAVAGTAWLSGRAAAMVWRLEALSIPNLEVTVVAASTPKLRSLRVRRSACPPHPQEVRMRGGLRVSSIPRMLIEIAAAGAVSTEPLHGLIEQAVRRSLLDIPDLVATLDRNLGRAGTVLVRRTCAEYLPHNDRKSGLERAFDRWLLSRPEIPPPLRNVRIGPWEIDCYWPEHELALELDGRPYHCVVAELDRDDRKNTWLQANGKRIMRVGDARFRRDKRGVHQELLMMLGLPELRHR